MATVDIKGFSSRAEVERLTARVCDLQRELHNRNLACEVALAHVRELLAGGAEAEVERLRAALTEWIAAHDAEKAAKVAAARARHKTFQGEPLPPKRMPKNAVLLSSLPADEQRRIDAEIERQMAPIREADAACNAAAERLAAAIRAARAALAPRSEGVDRGSRTLHDVPEREAAPEVPVTGWSVEAENVRAAAPVPSVLERRCGEDHQRPDRDDLGDVRNDAEPVLPGHADHHRAAEEDVA